MVLPIDRTINSTDAEHVTDHNTLHAFYNDRWLLQNLPIIGYWDASQLPGAVASSVSLLPDLSGYGHHLYQFTAASQPTIAAGPNSRKVLAMGTTKWMQRTSLGDGDWLAPTDYAQPTTFIAVVKAAATAPATRTILAASGSTNLLYLNSTTASPEISAGGTPVHGGPPTNDAAWHIIAAVFAGTGCAIFRDGYLVASSTSNGYGTDDLIGFYLGTSNGSTQMFDGEIAEVIVCNTALSHQSIYSATSFLASKWSIDISSAQLPAQSEDSTANGIAVRIWEPPNLVAGAPLVIINHQYGGNEQISAGFTAYSLVQACIAQRWRVAASNLHGNSWGNNTSMTDNTSLYTLMNARQAVTKVVMIGSSMGGVHTVLSIPEGVIPVVGCVLIDAVLDINNVYTAFKTSIDTAYGISSYASLPAGKDPMTRPAADYGTVRMRFYASTADTTISKTANTDAFRTKIAATALESGLSIHLGTHLASDAFWPSDVVSFISRCIV